MPSGIDNFKSLVESTLYPLVLDEYAAIPPLYPAFCEVLPWDNRYNLGERTDSVIGVGDPDEIAYGQEAPDRQFLDSWGVNSKARKFAHKFSITQEELDAINAIGRLPGTVEQFFMGQGTAFRQKKEKFVAGMLQKGTLTAGSFAYFGNAFTGVDAVSSDLFIYDGGPLYDTAHTLKGSSTTPSNHTAVAAISETTLQAALTLMEATSAVDERGNRIQNRMDTLVIPVGLEWTARVLLESALKAGSGNNDKNLLQGRLALQVNPYLSDSESASSWWLFGTQQRRAIRVRDSGEPRLRIYRDEPTNRVVMELSCQFMAACQNWRSTFCANKAA
jgi:hypothetical protein